MKRRVNSVPPKRTGARNDSPGVREIEKLFGRDDARVLGEKKRAPNGAEVGSGDVAKTSAAPLGDVAAELGTDVDVHEAGVPADAAEHGDLAAEVEVDD